LSLFLLKYWLNFYRNLVFLDLKYQFYEHLTPKTDDNLDFRRHHDFKQTTAMSHASNLIY